MTAANLTPEQRALAAGIAGAVGGTGVPDEIAALRAEVGRLEGLINTPHTADFFEAVRLEAAHQQLRWGVDHDAGKAPHDWFWLLAYLSGKALAAFGNGDKSKGLHHIISSAACLLNWHRHATGEMTAMRPGIAPPDEPRAAITRATGGGA